MTPEQIEALCKRLDAWGAYSFHEMHQDKARELFNEAAAALREMAAEVERLRKRGSEAVIAYHAAICSPKGVVPVDSFYDPDIAMKMSAKMDRQRTALSGGTHDHG